MSDEKPAERIPVPRRQDGDYTDEAAAERRDFVAERTGTALAHIGRYSFDPGVLPGNVENFLGVAQVPIGLAGPLRVRGEHARGDFYVPLATTEGTLVASYGRGMRLLSECGGVKTTIVRQAMQRAPVFLFEDARAARDRWRLGVEPRPARPQPSVGPHPTPSPPAPSPTRSRPPGEGESDALRAPRADRGSSTRDGWWRPSPGWVGAGGRGDGGEG